MIKIQGHLSMQLINLQQSMGRLASPRTQYKSRTDKILTSQQTKMPFLRTMLCGILYMFDLLVVDRALQSAEIEQMG